MLRALANAAPAALIGRHTIDLANGELWTDDVRIHPVYRFIDKGNWAMRQTKSQMPRFHCILLTSQAIF